MARLFQPVGTTGPAFVVLQMPRQPAFDQLSASGKLFALILRFSAVLDCQGKQMQRMDNMPGAIPATARSAWKFDTLKGAVMALAATFLSLFLLSLPALAQSEAPSATVAYGVAFEKTDDGWNLIVEFDGKPDTRAFLMNTPPRLVIETEGAVINLKETLGPEAAGYVGDIRFGAITTDKSRLVATMSGPHEITAKTLRADDQSARHDLILTLKPVSAERFAEIIGTQQDLLGTSGEVVAKGDRVRAAPRKAGTFAIVIDPGHGGIDGGAVGTKTGILEKDLVLQISRMIGDAVAKAGDFEVSYTRTEDVFVSLRERQAFARRQRADLMISVHADSLRQSFVRGATVYTLARKATDALSRTLAESENLADVVAGLAAPDSQSEVTDILADLTMRETTRFSRHFSSLLVSNMKPRIQMIKNPRRAASFAVLKNAEVPGVLVELGYLSNEEDEALLTDEFWQRTVAAAVATSVSEFFAGRRAAAN